MHTNETVIKDIIAYKVRNSESMGKEFTLHTFVLPLGCVQCTQTMYTFYFSFYKMGMTVPTFRIATQGHVGGSVG